MPSNRNARTACEVSRFLGFAMINGRFVRDLFRGDVGHHLAALFRTTMWPVSGDHADFGPRQIPLVENLLHFLFAALVHHDEHAFLGFGKHDFVAAHVGRALRHLVQLDLDAGARAGGGFARGARQAGGAHVLHAGDRAGGEQFQARFADELLHEGIAHLHRAALLLGRFLGQILRGKRRARQAVAPGGRAHVKDGVAHALGRAARDLFMPQHAQAKRVHRADCPGRSCRNTPRRPRWGCRSSCRNARCR